jgi:predicted DNA repair protein MutK
MASGFFAVLDDIAYLMDDVVTMSKLATKKTAGILGDDLSVNAEKATGFVSSRELPVLWKITKGSFLNKIIILPIAFLLSYFFPLGIKIVLVLGGAYLAYEGMHKIVHFIAHTKKSKKQHAEVLEVEITDTEKEKIKSAITTTMATKTRNGTSPEFNSIPSSVGEVIPRNPCDPPVRFVAFVKIS